MIEELKNLKEIYESARQQIDKVKEPLEDLNTLLNFLKALAQDPTIIREKVDKDYKRFFLEDFSQGMLKRLVKEKSKNENYLQVIGQILEQFLLIFNQQLQDGNYHFSFFDSVKMIFDYDTMLHNFHFQIPEDQLKKIRNTQQEWRNELKVGDMVDAIQDEFLKCPGWSQAKINNIAGDTLHLEFIYDTKNTDKYLDRWSVDIAQFETKTKELFEWKQSLQPKALVDGFDKTSWNKSTILDIKDQQISQDKTIKMAYLAFRVYVEKSTRRDDVGPYDGWSNRFDDWICLYSPRIQPYMTKSLKGGIEDVDIDENLDYLFNQEGQGKVFAVPRLRKCTSSLYINLLNMFGNIGGFQNILEVLKKSETEDIDLNIIAVLIECVSKAYLIFHKDFNREYAPQIIEISKKKLKNIPEKILREVKREKLEAIIKATDLLQRRTTSRDDRQMDVENIKLDLCLVCIRSSFLDRRIQGLKDLNTLIKNNRYLQNKGHTNEQLIQWMHDNDVFSVLFDNKKTHLQIVQRCADVLKLLLAEDKLTLALTEQFWNLSKSDYKPEVYKIVYEGASLLKQEHINLIFKQIKDMPSEKLTIEEFQCLSELGKHSNDESFRSEIGDFFWNVIIHAEDFKEEVVSSCITKFTSMVKNWSIEKKHSYFLRLTDAFKLEKPTLPCIKLFKSMLKDEVDTNFIEKIGDEMINSYPAKNNNTNEAQVEEKKNEDEQQIETQKQFSVKDSIEILFREKNLDQILLQNFKNYYEKLNQAITTEEINIDRKKLFIIDSKYSHHSEVDERLQLFKYLAEVSDFKIQKNELDIIYDLMVTKSKVSSDYEQFLIWCKSSCESSSSSVTILDLNQVGEFFTEKMKNKELDLKNLLMVGFEFLSQYFLSVNETQQKLIKSQKKQKDKDDINQINLASLYGLGIGPLPPNFFFGGEKKAKKVETESKAPVFNLVRPPNELSQLDIVWNIALECQNAKVVPRAINFLIKIYSSLDQDLNTQKIQIQDQLIDKCIQLLTETSENDEFRITRIIEIIKNIIYEAERKGTGGVQPHNAVLKGELLEKVLIKNKASNKVGNLTMQVYSNTTVWELRKVVAQKLDLAPKYLKLERSNGTVIKDLENGKTLSQLGFQNDETIYAFKNNIEEEVAIAPLIGPDNKLTEKAREIFNEWFDMYSDENGQMTKDTCQLFIKGCTGESPPVTDDRIAGIFKNYDSNNDGKIEREEFMTFYENAARNKADTVRENLKHHNVRADLKKLSEIVEESSYSKEDMPRYKISKNQQYFDILFRILDRHDLSSQATWDLIQMLATNQVLYKRVLELENAKKEGEETAIDWSKFFDTQSLYKLLYTLQITEAVMEFSGNDQRILVIKEEDTKNSNKLAQQAATVGVYPPPSGSLMNEISALEDDENKESNQITQQQPLYRKSTSIVEDDDVDRELRQGWTQMFLKYNGFSYILNVFMNKNLSSSTESGSNQDKFDQIFELKHYAFLLKLLRIFIITAFKSRERGTNQNVQSNQFIELQALLQGETGINILSQINYKDLQQKILQSIAKTLQKERMVFEDKLIIENALSLWIGIVSHHTELIEQFYTFTGTDGIKDSNDFIIHGVLYSQQEKVREEFKQALRQLGNLIIQKQGVEQPLQFILRILSDKFNEISNYQSQQYFNLFCDLIDKFFSLNKNTQAFNPEKLLVQIIEKIKEYNQLAQKQNQNGAQTKANKDIEQTYIGLIQIASKIIDNFDISFTEQIVEQNSLIDEIFVKFLFSSIFQENSLDINNIKISYKTSKSSSEQKSIFGNQSKEAAYILLNSLIKKSPSLMKKFLEKSLMPLMKMIRRIDTWNYSPPGGNERSQKYVGLKNLGCICYMNSMIQQFYMIPAFRYNLLCVDDHLPEDLVEYKGWKIDDNVLHQFQKLIAHLELSERQDYNPFEFCFAFKDIEGNPTNIGEQKDAQEFLNLLFDRVENQLRNTSRKYLLQSVFGGQTCSQMVCLECGKVRNKIEDFYNLSLPVKDFKSMEESLKKMIEGEVINDFFCEGCQKKVDISRRTLISSTPNVLIVHLQRIIFNFDTFKNDKINTYWEFPNQLDLTPYSFYDVMKKENRLKKKKEGDENEEKQQQQDEDNVQPDEEDCFEYKLVGANVHSGTAHAGHYWSYINTQRGFEEPGQDDPKWGRTEDDEWLEFNDSQVKDFNFEKLKEDCFGKKLDNMGSQNANMSSGFSFGGFGLGGDNYGKSAYMLIYERRKKKPLKVLLSDEDLEQEKQKAQRQETSEILHDPKKEENYKLIDYRTGAIDIKPNKIYQQVLEDNMKFQFENDIYSAEFFDFIRQNLIAATNLRIEGQEETVKECKIEMMRIGKKAIYEILAKCMKNKSITKLTELYINLLRSDINVLPKLFMEQCYEEDQYDYLITLLLECTDAQARQALATLLKFILSTLKFQEQLFINETQLVQRVNEKGEIVETETRHMAQSSRFIMKCLSILNTRAAKNWMRLDYFLDVIQYFGLNQDSDSQDKKDQNDADHKLQEEIGMTFLMKQNIVQRACDFVLGKKSPLCGPQEKRQELGGAYSSPNFSAFIKLITRVITDEALLAKFPMTQLENQMFLHPDLLKVMLGSSQGSKQFGKCIANMCKDNFRLSKKVAKVFVKAINTANYDQIKNYLTAIKPFLKLQDSLKLQKIEWIFGFSQVMCKKGYREERYKYGIESIGYINEEAALYTSPLALGATDDALLAHLQKCRATMDNFSLNCLKEMLHLMSKDDQIARFMYTSFAPTYAFARFSDWFRSYIEAKKADAERNATYTYMKAKIETINASLIYLKIYEDKCLQFLKEDFEKLEKIQAEGGFKDLSEDWLVNQVPEVYKHYPPQIVIGKQVGEEKVFLQNEDHPDIKIIVQEIQNEYNYGNPQGLYNLSAPHLEIKTNTYATMNYEQFKKFSAQLEKSKRQQLRKQQKEFAEQELQGENSQDAQQTNNEANQQDQDAKSQKTQDSDEDQEEEVVIKVLPWEERSKVGSVLLRVLAVGTSKKKMSVKVSFRAEDGTDANMKLPYSYFKEEFTNPETKVLGHLLKIDPSKPWGKIEMFVEVKEKDQQVSQAPPTTMGLPIGSIMISCINCEKFNDATADKCTQCGTSFKFSTSNDEGTSMALDTQGLSGDHMDHYFDTD